MDCLVGAVGYNYDKISRNDDLDIIIAHRGDPMGLWATISSCESDLFDTGLKYSYRIVCNGEDVLPATTVFLKDSMDRTDKLGSFLLIAAPTAPPLARQIATEKATGKYLFFFDNHCVIQKGYFKRAIEQMDKHNMSMLHSVTQHDCANPLYHYPLTLEQNFWMSYPSRTAPSTEPYRIAMAGHGGFVVRREVWEKIGGYGSPSLFEGYGGEEPYLDLKAALLGYDNWLDPKLIHYHFWGKRPYPCHNNDKYYINLLTSAYVIGGETWLLNVASNLVPDVKDMKSLSDIARSRGYREHEDLAAKRLMTLEELLVKFDREGIAH